MNERQVLATLQSHGALSRAEIARSTGISLPTVTRVVSSLIESQLLDEQEPTRNAVGRPGKLVRLATKSVCVLGCVLGAKQCTVVASGLDGSIDERELREFVTPGSFDELVASCVQAARALMRSRKATVLGMGVSVPGLLNRRQGRSLVSPNLHQIDGQDLGAALGDRLQMDVLVAQECHALCLAEQMYGLAKGLDEFAMLDVSEGLGLGVVERGSVLHGHSGLAGELGHVTAQLDGRLCGCGNRGCLETLATDAALAEIVSERLGQRLSIEEILTQVQAGTLAIDAELERVLDYLAVAASAVINIFNPSRLFLFGRLLDARADLFDELIGRVGRRALAPSLADCQIVRARGNKRQGAIAAAIRGVTHGWSPL
jgi:N-acetylglucosamine repressor